MLTSFACTTRWLSQKSPYMSILGKRWAKVKKANERKKNVNLFVAVGEWSSCIKVFLISFFWWRGRGNLPKWKGERVSEKNCVSSKYIMFLVGHWRRTLNYKVPVVNISIYWLVTGTVPELSCLVLQYSDHYTRLGSTQTTSPRSCTMYHQKYWFTSQLTLHLGGG